ncbi:hypothetical protein Pla175_17760 [Pirellulimonas nuda]|uniref:Helicase C-terminal domain-containing protein n=1 Tax=Pirellulimonas nuda TaxID=2528009 RepID=A0A518DA95_9BACT|nr:DISARM system helicase DrmA [Pirellulimonas nuda]QDU88400.1 hypothetical protein Pla175_17760 [Pirellulimonas nuda]
MLTADLLSAVPSQAAIREELERMLIGDLLGPAAGQDEEITERSVRDRYLVGVLSPSRGASGEPSGGKEDEDDFETPLIPDELAAGGSDNAQDGVTDRDVPAASGFLPSSIGLTFSVEGETEALRVSVEWGQYRREKREEQQPPRIWKRYPRGGSIELKLAAGSIKPQAPDPEFPEVYVQGQVRRRDEHWVVTLFLVNAQEEGTPKDESYIFQSVLAVEGPAGEAPFCKRMAIGAADDLEERMMAMLYRRQVEFAVGHGVSVHAEPSPDRPDRATALRTVFLPTYEVPRTTPPTPSDAAQNPAFAKLEGLVLDMKELAEADGPRLQKLLAPLVTAYRAWIEGEAVKLNVPEEQLAPYGDASRVAVDNCRQTLSRIEQGLGLLRDDPQAFEAFCFMNRAMWYQRTHSLYAERKRRGEDPDFSATVDVPKNRTWRSFQIAFVLLNLPGVTQLDHADRGEGAEALADLLFFPTGGGKTEAYLGLSAYTMGLRRLQGTVAGRSGAEGVAVLMRYTLRLLTLQQFQRATALVCACESIRRKALEKGDARWGTSPFRIGLWVGRRTTPNRTDDAAEAIKQLRGNQYNPGGGGSPYQLTTCPWCGSEIDGGRDLEAQLYPSGSARTLTFCGDKTGQCIFSKRQAREEGLPIVVVDEEVYRRLPTLLIATVDKFAQMAWKGEVQMLFGQVNGYCDRHGFRSPEVEEATQHPKTKSGAPAVKVQDHSPLRPPDLVIQDELHLISGPLGTLVGLYETAIDKLCTWEVEGRKVRPKVIASTATIKNANVQVHNLFLRTVSVFPPPGLDVSDNFFSLQRTPTEDDFGRRYLGVCSPGRRLKGVLVQVSVSLLCSARSLYEKYGKAADPWMTLVGYFNSIRELGGMRRLVDDSIQSRCQRQDRRGLAKRYLGSPAELTSRMRSEEIPRTLDHLESVFDPEMDQKRKDAYKSKNFKGVPKKPLDILLATNMISVGVDVSRLGVMLVAGQPKATAEYIQATSRVGRAHPGLVVTVYNWARPRDLSHYETFEHYHGTFYKHVEPLSVTPFAPGALQRGLAGLLVSMVRQRGEAFNANASAGKLTNSDPYVQEAIEAICRRAEQIGDGGASSNVCRAELSSKADLWQAEAQNTAGGRKLTYTKPYGENAERGTSVALLQSAGEGEWEPFTCLNSLRDVEPTVKFIISDGGLDGDAAVETSEADVEPDANPIGGLA